MLKVCAFGLAAAAGMATAGGTPVTLQGKIVPEEEVGYLYINLATGERIATVTDQQVGPRDGNTSENIWIADNRLPCSAYGQTGGSSGLIDQISDTGPAGDGWTADPLGGEIKDGVLYGLGALTKAALAVYAHALAALRDARPDLSGTEVAGTRMNSQND